MGGGFGGVPSNIIWSCLVTQLTRTFYSGPISQGVALNSASQDAVHQYMSLPNCAAASSGLPI